MNIRTIHISFISLIGLFSMGTAQNPIIQTNYTADPAPMVYNDRLYVYTHTMRMIPPVYHERLESVFHQ